MMKKWLIAIIVVLLGLGAVVFVMNDKKSTDNQVKNEEKITLKIGMVTFAGYAPLYVAQEKGFFENINVELVRIESIGDLRAAMQSGSIDMYIATPDIFQSAEKNKPVGVGFLAIDESTGADGVVASGDIQSVEELKGKKVGAEPGFPPYFVLQYMLYKHGMSLADIDFKDMSSQTAANAFIANQLDAAGTYEPYLSNAVSQKNGSKILISSADTKGLIVDIIFASEKLYQNNPATLAKIAKGWYKAVEFYNTNPKEAIAIMSKAFRIAPEEMIDIKSGLSWLNKNDNLALFDTTKADNIFTTFDMVGEILLKNGGSNVRVYAKDKLTDTIVKNEK